MLRIMKVNHFDTETTGLDAVKNDIIQIAGIIEIDGEVMEEFHFKCQPHSYENISPQALKINGYTVEQLKTFEDPHVIHKKLVDIFSKYIDKYDREDKFYPAGQNIRFDMGFLKEFFAKCGDPYYGSWFNYDALDLLGLSALLRYKGRLDVENLKLGTLAKHLGVELKAHDAVEDIRATRIILNKLLDTHIN